MKNRVVVAKEALEAAEQLQEALSASLSEDSRPEERTTLEHTRHQISRHAPSFEGSCSRAQPGSCAALPPEFMGFIFLALLIGQHPTARLDFTQECVRRAKLGHLKSSAS